MRQDRSDRPAGRRASRGLAVLALVPAFGLLLATAAYADVSAVSGSAFGERVNVTTLARISVNSGPIPLVTLPPGGSATPITDSLAQVNLAVLRTGVLNVSTRGTIGPSGSVTSSATVANPNVGVPVVAPNVLVADAVSSSCTSNETGSTGTSTITNLRLLGVASAAGTAPNTTVNIANVGILHINEQVVTGTAPTSSITVNALRLEINAGGLGSGSITIGQSVCGVTGAGIPTPSGAVGGVLLTGLVAVAFVGDRLWRRRRPSEG